MANEQLTIAQNKARLTVIGKSYDAANTDSGSGETWPEITLEELVDMGYDIPEIDDFIIGTLDGHDWPVLIWDDDIMELEGLDIGDLNLNWELNTPFSVGDIAFDLDDNFDIEEKNLPHSIAIVTMPLKTEYVNGKPIDITGMVVTAKNADDSTWTSAKYPNGHVPLGELMISPKIASSAVTPENGMSATGFWQLQNIQPDQSGHQGQSEYNYIKFSSGVKFIGVMNGTDMYVVSGSLSSYSGTSYGETGGEITDPERTTTASKKKMVAGSNDIYYIVWGPWYSKPPIPVIETISSSNPSTDGLDYIFQTVDGQKAITVRWSRPEDGKILETKFPITILPGGGGR